MLLPLNIFKYRGSRWRSEALHHRFRLSFALLEETYNAQLLSMACIDMYGARDAGNTQWSLAPMKLVSWSVSHLAVRVSYYPMIYRSKTKYVGANDRCAPDRFACQAEIRPTDETVALILAAWKKECGNKRAPLTHMDDKPRKGDAFIPCLESRSGLRERSYAKVSRLTRKSDRLRIECFDRIFGLALAYKYFAGATSLGWCTACQHLQLFCDCVKSWCNAWLPPWVFHYLAIHWGLDKGVVVSATPIGLR